MSLLDRFRGRLANAPEQRKHQSFGPPAWAGSSYTGDSLPPISMRAGYCNNPVSYRALRMIAEACASIPLKVDVAEPWQDGRTLEDALRNPNSYCCQTEFLERLYLDLLAFGNSYVEAVQTMHGVEFYLLRPDHVTIVSDADGWPISYDHQHGGQVRRLRNHGDQPTILHVKFHCPGDDHYGYGPLQAARGSIAMHNTAMEWNRSLFVNAARPSGALVYKGADGQGHLTEEQFERLKRELEDNFQGAGNAGRPLLLEGGLDWSSISLSPQDMEFISAKHSAARDIALAFGVPPMLLGIPGDNTYSNYAEANRAFWRQTIIPLKRRVTSALSRFMHKYYPNAEIVIDLDAVPALAEERQALWARLSEADFLSRAEKRVAAGYPPEDS
jgi:HK97 family phage portal protein